jgi:competence protein ComEC
LATGDDATMTYEQRQAFVTTGTSHITAVSGSNFALLVMMISFAAGFAMSTRSPWRLAAVGIVIWSYAALVGGSPPALRAAIVATLALSAAAIGRRPDFITLSVVAAAVGVLLRPRDIDSLAFQLSTVSAIALVLGLGGRVLGGRLGWLRQGVYSTADTQAATAAILVPAFGRFSLYAIPANVFIGPLCGAAFPIALFAGLTGLVCQSVATAIAFPGAVLAELTLLTVRWFAELPGANIGADRIGALPAPVWVAFGMLVVVALSKECQGGIARLVRNARSADSRVRAVAIGASAGGIAGAIAASLVR